jgi:hypothetical protein
MEMMDDKWNERDSCPKSRGNCQSDWVDSCGFRKIAGSILGGHPKPAIDGHLKTGH